MRPALAYRPSGGPLDDANPLAASLYLASFAVVAFAFSNPIVLAGAAAGVVVAAHLAGAGPAARAAARWGLWLGVIFVLVNAITAQRGDTILVRGFDVPVIGNTDVTLESLAYGAALGLRIVVVVLAFAVYSACVDPDRVLRLLRPVARRSAMTAGLVTRMVPLAVADGARLSEAAELRGPAAAPVGRAEMTRRLVESSLDRAVDVAATLELRGHSLDARPRFVKRRSRDDASLYLAGFAILVVTIWTRLAGLGSWDVYPRIELEAGPGTLLLCAGIVALSLVPFGWRRWRRRG